MKGPEFVPNVLTACSLCCGLFVVFTFCMADTISYVQLRMAIEIILLAAVLDVLDGAVARAINGSTAFGGFFDSMSDGIAFGVAPVIIVVKVLALKISPLGAHILVASGIMYALAGVLRLVRFSTTPKTDDSSFVGLPITAAAMACMSALFVLACHDSFPWVQYAKIGIASSVLVFLSYLMVSRWRFPSVKTLNMNLASTQLALTVMVVVFFLTVAVVNDFAIVFCLTSWIYVLGSWARAMFIRPVL